MNHGKQKIYFGWLSPHITIPTTITPRPRTLIENIFMNTVNKPSISGNLMCSISDHLAVSYLPKTKC